MKKSVSILVWSNRKPWNDIDIVIDSWHGNADEERLNQIVQKFEVMYKPSGNPNKYGFSYRIQIVER